jgi:hypothetical protein
MRKAPPTDPKASRRRVSSPGRLPVLKPELHPPLVHPPWLCFPLLLLPPCIPPVLLNRSTTRDGGGLRGGRTTFRDDRE